MKEQFFWKIENCLNNYIGIYFAFLQDNLFIYYPGSKPVFLFFIKINY